jgi:hypothetical protein
MEQSSSGGSVVPIPGSSVGSFMAGMEEQGTYQQDTIESIER